MLSLLFHKVTLRMPCSFWAEDGFVAPTEYSSHESVGYLMKSEDLVPQKNKQLLEKPCLFLMKLNYSQQSFTLPSLSFFCKKKTTVSF